jgi:diguanylate cyclase (GGDEF)-like protein
LLYVLLVVLTLSVLVVMIFENQLDLIAENAVLSSRIVGERVRSILANEDETETRLELLSAFDVDRLALYSELGVLRSTVLGDGFPAEAEAQLLRNINTAITRRDFENQSFYHELDYEQRRVELYIPVRVPGGTQVAFAEVTLGQIDEYLTFLYRQALLVGLLLIVLHGLYALYLARSLIKPMRTLLGATSEISRGNLEVQVPMVRRDELGDLATAFNEMSVAIRRMRDQARQSNPLTELPGNNEIARVINSRLEAQEDFAVLYVDLDNFKAYNDLYGFALGDRAILFTKNCLIEAAEQFGGSFVGHQGGDDFVLVCAGDDAIELAELIVKNFQDGRNEMYQESDTRRGYIETEDRRGNMQRFPLMAVSIAVVRNRRGGFSHHAEIATVAAEVKKIAKKDSESSYALDARRASGDTGEKRRFD